MSPCEITVLYKSSKDSEDASEIHDDTNNKKIIMFDLHENSQGLILSTIPFDYYSTYVFENEDTFNNMCMLRKIFICK